MLNFIYDKMFFNQQKNAGPNSQEGYPEESFEDLKTNARNNQQQVPSYQIKTVSNNAPEDEKKSNISKLSSGNSLQNAGRNIMGTQAGAA